MGRLPYKCPCYPSVTNEALHARTIPAMPVPQQYRFSKNTPEEVVGAIPAAVRVISRHPGTVRKQAEIDRLFPFLKKSI
ncbi:MAG: hypothetical protein M1481_07530 [Candidatus Thermoplasmatota archaeon]|nr:hypothetical protein [Candidatus Thermoplasmatota archaeon]MCL5963688.1 hypothetical protein [Candidatus Thermoplasmatota archaeon]